jgi:Ca2+:H+ antiporter
MRQRTRDQDDPPSETTHLLSRTSHSIRTHVSDYSHNIWSTTYAVLKSNYVNVLLVFVPIGIVAGVLGWAPATVFALNFVAIIPLASLLSFATEEISLAVGETLGGLLNATFGNAVELIVSIAALLKGEIALVQASMLGSILSNLLLVLGCCFLAGGYGRISQSFNETVASTMSSLMAVSCASLIIPATLYAALSSSKHANSEDSILLLSRGTSIILLVLYVMFLYFQLYSHKEIFATASADVESRPDTNGHQAPASTLQATQEGVEEAHEDDKEDAILSPWAAAIVLVLITICVAVCAEFLVDSIEDVVKEINISKTFIGLILLPIVGNAAEHVTAVVVSVKNKMDLAIGVAVGSSMQIALLVTPFLVILGWIIGQPMTLYFQPFITVVFFLSVLVVNYLIQDGQSNYLEGAMLIGT